MTLKEKLKQWRAEPGRFVREVIGAEPSAQQDAILAAVAKPGARVTVKSGHGTGKSCALSWLLLWHVLCFLDSKAPCTAPVEKQLRDVLWGEARKWRDHMPPAWRDQVLVGSDRIAAACAPETQYATYRTARKGNADALQGFHASHVLYVIDEASGVDDAVFEAARGALSTEGSRIILIGNPTRAAGFFWASHCGIGSDGWERLTLSCAESPHVSPEYLEEMKREYGEGSDVYRVRVLGEFPKNGITQLVGEEVARAAAGREIARHQYEHAPVVLGVDVGWFGDDRSAVFWRQGLASRLLFAARGVDTMTLAGLVAQEAGKHGAEAVFVDATGVGAGVADALRGMSPCEVYPVMFGGAGVPDKGTAFANKRAECWWRMRGWLQEGGCIPADDKLVAEICAPEYGYTMTGAVQLESKKDIKRRLGASPDLADALALTFAFPVAPRGAAKRMCECEPSVW